MLVDVVRMRVDGVKRPRDAILNDVPTRAELLMKTSDWRDPLELRVSEPTTFAFLAVPGDPPGGQSLLPMLVRASKRPDGENGFVVVGEEMHYGTGTPYRPQAWWCRVVHR